MWLDFKLALRSLCRSPGYTLAVVVTLALGIGATAAIYSNVRAGLRPVTYAQMDRLVRIEGATEQGGFPPPTVMLRHFAFRREARSFASLAGGTWDTMNLVANGEPEGVSAARVSANFFTILGVKPYLGRTFQPGEDEAGRDGVVVIAHAMWRARFGADESIVGKKILLNDRSYEVIGVLPESFQAPIGIFGRMFVPYVLPPAVTPENALEYISTFARLKDGVTREQAEAELRAIPIDLTPQQAERLRNMRIAVVPIAQLPASIGNNRNRTMHWTAVGAVAFLYLIACVNAGSLMLVRTMGRRREVGVRLALGGGRWSVVRPLLAESLILATGGVMLGVLVAKWFMPVLMAVAPGSDEAYKGGIRLSVDTLFVLAGLGVLTAVGVASAPAWRTARMNVNDALKDGSQRGGESRRMRGIRNTLVVIETALAVALLAGTGLMIRTVHRLTDYHPGHETENRFGLSLAQSREHRLMPEERLERYKVLADRLGRMPGVESVSVSSYFTATNYRARKIRIDGRLDEGEIDAHGTAVGPEFLGMIGLPLRAGRSLGELRPGDPVSVVVSESFARNYFHGRSPIGERLQLSPTDKWEIIGVVGDVRSARQEAKPRFYYPYWQTATGWNFFPAIFLKTASTPGPMFYAEVRRAIYEVEPMFAVTGLIPIGQSLKWEVMNERFTMVVLEVLAALALVLALLGLFAMQAYTAAQRRTEFGIRMTFGATAESIERLVVRGGLALSAIGVVAGLGLAWGMSRFIDALLHPTGGRDPVVFAIVGLSMLLAALPACWLPARKAARIDVARLLRPD